MRTFLQLPNEQTRTLPAAFHDDDVRYTEALVAHFVREFTEPQQVVFDPFAGFGTTLIAAEALGRIAYGLEYDAQRVAYIKAHVQQPGNVLQGDARHVLRYGLPRFAFSMTSPPYMQRADTEDPLTAYTTTGDGYGSYLQSLRAIYAQLAQLMQDDAHMVVEVANLKGDTGITTLAWDIAAVLADVLQFVGEVVVGWDTYGYGYDHSYCLIFTKAHTHVPADA
jgi:tRNA G10  N-methylase Trm11